MLRRYYLGVKRTEQIEKWIAEKQKIKQIKKNVLVACE